MSDLPAKPAPTPLTRTLTICNVKGLHARASAKFVETVECYNAEAMVSKDGMDVEATSIMGLLMLAAAKGSQILVSATGPEAEALLDGLEALIAARFGEGV